MSSFGFQSFCLALRYRYGVLRKILGSQMDEVAGDSKILEEEEALGRYCSPNLIRVMKSGRIRWAGHVERMGQKRSAHRVLMGKSGEKRPPGR